jgi:hypothetical protein
MEFLTTAPTETLLRLFAMVSPFSMELLYQGSGQQKEPARSTGAMPYQTAEGHLPYLFTSAGLAADLRPWML